jgi:hypothetical protein
VAFDHDDGEGFNTLLQALPTDAKLVLRTYKEKPEEQEKVIKAKFIGSVAQRDQLTRSRRSSRRLFLCANWSTPLVAGDLRGTHVKKQLVTSSLGH